MERPLYFNLEKELAPKLSKLINEFTKKEKYRNCEIYFLGHSLGSLVCYQVACEMFSSEMKLPKKLFLMAKSNPKNKIKVSKDPKTYTTEDVKNLLENLGG